jgi:hypothetical protein
LTRHTWLHGLCQINAKANRYTHVRVKEGILLNPFGKRSVSIFFSSRVDSLLAQAILDIFQSAPAPVYSLDSLFAGVCKNIFNLSAQSLDNCLPNTNLQRTISRIRSLAFQIVIYFPD